ncbi:MAG: hypothetical protein APF80_06580 [Alphaproteobacteria bacterium BRH_c36]|nr:MAG: hypothetical protein APF80_06580 [Alphaproteobacteria bacterium BRH_c36]
MGADRLMKAWFCTFAGTVMIAAVTVLPARAVETFVCDDGRVLTLTSEQVDALVLTDPCIAKYYGRTIDPAASPAPATPQPPSTVAAPVAEPPPAVPVDLPLPERRPEDIAAKLRTLDVDPTAPAGERPPVAIADVPSDFRNVHIINGAKSGEPQFFKHTR